mmetsp:Transcript_31414/g.75752  ORF Transcript_31414/g.75752 Transcript_31414/m.75752 type:complete len:88 (-) Transcript_31414:2182-2445(-)
MTATSVVCVMDEVKTLHLLMAIHDALFGRAFELFTILKIMMDQSIVRIKSSTGFEEDEPFGFLRTSPYLLYYQNAGIWEHATNPGLS